MVKALVIFVVILIGAVFTIGSEWKFLIRPNLMAMLFFSFLSIKLDRQLIRRGHLFILISNLALPVVFFLLLKNVDQTIALCAFIIGLIPTAVAAPILAQIMDRDVGIVTFSVLLTTPVVALSTPLLLLLVLDAQTQFSLSEIILPILTLIGIPLVLSQIIRRVTPLNHMDQLKKLGKITFPLFLLNLFIACGDASRFLQNNSDYERSTLLGILSVTIAAVLLQFQLGRLFGSTRTRVEFSLSLGRKNTMLGIWLAITYFEPIIILGPVCYILLQNIYNSLEIAYLDRWSKR